MWYEMAYKIIDKQIAGREFGDGAVFKNKKEVKEQLIDFHSADTDEADLKVLKKMSLNELLDFGDWRLEKVKDRKSRKKLKEVM
jgi:hypothetical protein